MNFNEYLATATSLLANEHYETFAVTDYGSFPQCVNSEKEDLVRDQYAKKYERNFLARGKPQLLINPDSVKAATFKMAAKKVKENQFAECSNFAAAAAGVLLRATENGTLDANYNITLAGISDAQNHNVVIIYPKHIPAPTCREDFLHYKKDIMIVDPWSFALGHGESSVYTIDNFPFPYMLSRVVTHYESKNDMTFLEGIAQSSDAGPSRSGNPAKPPMPVVIEKPRQTSEVAIASEPTACTQFLLYGALFTAGAGLMALAYNYWSDIPTSAVVLSIGTLAAGFFATSKREQVTTRPGAAINLHLS